MNDTKPTAPSTLAEATGSGPDETVVRAMRDQVYGHPSSDKNWEGCRENWMQTDSFRWLRARTKQAQNDQADRPAGRNSKTV